MFVGIDRESGLFEPDVADELNTSFSNLQDKIQTLKAPDLKYHYRVKPVNVSKLFEDISFTNRSIKVGKELILDITVTFKEDKTLGLYETLKLFKLNENVPYRYWGNVVVGDENYNLRFFLHNFEVSLGTSRPFNETVGFTLKKNTDYILQARLILAD